MLRAAVYARVSGSEQQARNTIASQLATLPAYCTAQGWRVVATYIDDGRSAKAGQLEKRDGLRDMLASAKAGAFDVVAVVDLNRLTRAEDIAERGMIYGALQAAGVQIAVRSSGQLLDLRTQIGDLFAALGGVFAADENRKRIEATVRGKIHAAERGKKPAGPTPFGYSYDRATGAWSIDPELGPVIVEIHRRIAAGETCEDIAQELDRRGVPRCAPSKRGLRKVGRWNRERVWELAARSTVYHTGRYTVDKARGLAVDVPQIISEATYRATQRQLARYAQRGKPRHHHPRLIGGLATCALCGSEIVGSQVLSRTEKRRVLYYVCSMRRRPRNGQPRCMLPMFRSERIDAAVWRWACSALSNEGELERALQDYHAPGNADLTLLEQDLDAARRRLKRLADVERIVLGQQREGLLSADGARAELQRIASERRFAQGEVDGLEGQRARYTDRAGAAAELADALEQLRAGLAQATYPERRRILELLVPGEGPYVLRLGPERIEARMSLATAPSALVGLVRSQAGG